MANHSSVLFHTPAPHTPLNASAMTNRTTALEVCYSVYGENSVAGDFIDTYYDTNAGIYENPFVTATSRSIIGDIHRLSHQLSSLDIPRPLAMLCTLFRLEPPRSVDANDYLFQALRIWTDVADICENESFDGTRKVIVEHTLNIILFPGIHCEGPTSHRSRLSGESIASSVNSPVFPTPHFLAPSLPIPGTSLSFPSPLHRKLRIVTRLSFNEQGLVTHHRDIWDVKDVMGLVPGVALGQWIGTRIAAVGLSYISRLMPNHRGKAPMPTSMKAVEVEDLDECTVDDDVPEVAKLGYV